MKTKIAVLATAALLISAPAAFAFHSGGVAECEGCHSMHNSFEGSANATGLPQYESGPYLLKANDQSGSCLNCHEAGPGSYHISTPSNAIGPNDSTVPVQLTPGGDFAWLKKTMPYAIRGAAATFDGDRHGHNIVASDFGYTADKTLTTAPGGTYPAANLACSSCHDPHGTYRRFADGTQKRTGLPIFASGSYTSSAAPISGVSAVGVYRILGGVGYQPKSLTGSYAFAKPAPDAVAQSTYNKAATSVSAAGAAQPDLVAYGQGMSEYCANCHTAMLENSYTSGMKGLVHPAGNSAKLTAAIAANYAAYVTSGVMTGTGANYSAVAPFEIGTNDYTILKAFPTTPTAATAGTSNVNCLSCHRAHASGFESMARYNLSNEFMTVADAAGAALYDSSTTENKINFGLSVAQQTAAYNGRPATAFGPYARNYCNKCHAKD
ncbi:cytochrome C [Geomonas agri]|uniref:cytochrome C n=1 Tax=Geomonas agri TaxID=2873702 RepID=UPI001CD69858|nr:cytochrome C [Geomonas agri]